MKYPSYYQKHKNNNFQENFIKSGQNFDFQYPLHCQNCGGYEFRDYFIIRDPDDLVNELLNLYNKPTVDFYNDRGVWNSKGINGVNNDTMIEYLNSHYSNFNIDNWSNLNRSLGTFECANYIADKFHEILMRCTDQTGRLLGYKMRYIFGTIYAGSNAIRPFVTNQEYNNILRVMSKDLKRYAFAYAFVPAEVNDLNCQTIDFIISNGSYYRDNRNRITLYKNLGGMRNVINSDLSYVYNNSIEQAIAKANKKHKK